MTIYNYLNYKDFIKEYISTLPANGRGEYGRMAKAMQISSTLVSQIFNGVRELSLEQSFLMSDYLNLSSDEREYLELLVLKERSGLKKQKDFYLEKIRAVQEKNKSFKKFVKPRSLELSKEDELVYYTEWIHASIRLLSELKEFQSLEALSKKLKVDLEVVRGSAEFLNRVGLVDYKNGRVTGLKNNLHQEKDSALTLLRQQTWRMKALENFQRKDKNDYFFNALMTIEEKQFEKIKEILAEAVGEIGKQVGEVKSPKKMLCLNIDFFGV